METDGQYHPFVRGLLDKCREGDDYAGQQDIPDSAPLGPTIQVLVGDEQFKFTVHSGLLVAGSIFFFAVLAGNLEEAREITVKVPEIDPLAFEVFNDFLYCKAILFGPIITSPEDRTQLLLQAWILGDQLRAYEFQNAVMIELCYDVHQGVRPHKVDVKHVYGHTVVGSPLRKLLAFWFLLVDFFPESFMDAYEYPSEFFFDCMKLASSPGTRSMFANPSEYPWMQTPEEFVVTDDAYPQTPLPTFICEHQP